MTQNPTQSKEKQEIANAAVKSFRDDLSRWESLTLSPIASTLDDIILSDQEIPDNFTDMEALGTWKYLYAGLSFFGVEFLDQLFSFLKEKQEELHKAQSRLELLKLKQSITGSLTAEELAEIALLEQTVTSPTSPTSSSSDEVSANDGGDDQVSAAGSDEIDESIDPDTDGNNNQTGGGTPPSSDENQEGASTIRRAVTSSVAIAGASTAAGKGVEKLTGGPLEQVSARVNPDVLNKHVDDYIKLLEYSKDNDMLTSRQKKNIQKTIDNLKETKISTQGVDDLALWKKLANKNVLPAKVFGALNLSAANIAALAQLSDNEDLMKQLARSTDVAEIKTLLSGVGIDATDSLVGVFRNANTIEDVTGATRLLANTKRLGAMAKFVRAVPFLDAAAAGLDIWVYLETGKEAELIRQTNTLRAANKQSQANFTLGMGMIDAAVGVGSAIYIAAVGLASAGPVGRIGLGVAATGYGIQQMVETAYFDVRNQYLQNTHDYLGQYRTEVKHAIMQATIRGDSSINLSFTEGVGEWINAVWNFHTFGSWEQEDIDLFVPQTLEDAYRALFLMDELQGDTYGYMDYLSFEHDPEKQNSDPDTYKQLTDTYVDTNKRVALRLEYISPYLPHSNNGDYQKLHNSIVQSGGMTHLEQLIHESATFADFHTTTHESLQGAASIEEYTDKYQERLSGRDGILYDKLHNYSQQSPTGFAELALSTQQWITFAGGIEGTDADLLSRAQFIIDYRDYYQISHPEARLVPTPRIIDYVAMDETLRGLHNTELTVSLSEFDTTRIANRLYGNYDSPRASIEKQATSSVGTNIVYEIARQLHHYDGNNRTLDLIQFFSVEKADTLGLYYDGGRYINEDWAFDHAMNIHLWDTWPTEKIIRRIAKNDMIDTASERADDWINTEYHQQLISIIRKEKSYQTPEKKAETIQTIVELAQHGQGYVLLPDTLVADAIKSGIGIFSETYVSYDASSDKLLLLSRDSNDVFDLGEIALEQQHVAVLRETLSDQEYATIEGIDNQMQHLIDLRSIKSWTSHEDELDIPVEVERGLTQLVYDREATKKRLHTLDPYAAEQLLKTAKEKYGKTSENMYQAILYNISQTMISNDQEGSDILSALRRDATVPPKGETVEGSIFEWTDEGLVMSTTVGYHFDDSIGTHLAAIIKEHKIDGKTIHELLNSDDSEDFATGASYVPLLLQAILESKYLFFDEEQKIHAIVGGGGSNLSFSRETVIKRFDHLLGLIPAEVETEPQQYTTRSSTETPDISIESQNPLTTTINTTIAQVSNDIYGQQHSVDRGAQRKRIVYNPRNQSIESRNTALPLSIENNTVGLPHFDFRVPLAEVIRFANFVNKLHHDYKTNEIVGWEIDISGALQVDLADRYRDVNLLSSYSLNRYFPTLAHDKDVFIEGIEKTYTDQVVA